MVLKPHQQRRIALAKDVCAGEVKLNEEELLALLADMLSVVVDHIAGTPTMLPPPPAVEEAR